MRRVWGHRDPREAGKWMMGERRLRDGDGKTKMLRDRRVRSGEREREQKDLWLRAGLRDQ